MDYFLREVFDRACAFTTKITQKIEDAYLYTGFMVWRLTQDDQFLALSPGVVDSPALKLAINFYDMGKNKAQLGLAGSFEKMLRTNDHGPKPDIKPGLFAIAQNLSPLVSKMNLGNPVIAIGLTIIGCAAAYVLTHSGAGHGIQDTVATVYGTTNGQRPAPPRTE